jgi:hypothetical protein
MINCLKGREREREKVKERECECVRERKREILKLETEKWLSDWIKN